ncbi:hypothetical protein [Vibrio caribbeanicus]|uniref:hypothetical protein n=1 Tax=Vibrio caribbeanicus TaxID=701175 RepID=UPI00228415C5|nr:hypothetical protein [Vibrio caribbeanicus]MCY9843797.1 hypothetical protein [Vibrio caribbeanicus]
MNSALNNNFIVQRQTESISTTKDHLVSNLGIITEAIQRGLSVRRMMTENNPVTSSGQYFYGEVVRALRELLKPVGYEKASIRNVELTINKTEGIAIYLCSGCEQTGNLSGAPQSIRQRGDFTLELLSLKYDDSPNIDLFPELLPEAKPQNKLNCEVWFLLHFFDKTNNSVKAELARAISYDKKGFVTGFDRKNRIIINIDSDEIVDIAPDFTDVIDFDIG